ncbi:clavesin-1-like isoform X2 [Cimex lectularius]|uniref:CRAL-TRIO domain-containing protein n=1 Tax=Cimex lectularius TaxID=79782 RepID=A0A8I6RE95_CIMLE|nr:clavesin-1-like isoform X2 [Cimex lectularius]
MEESTEGKLNDQMISTYINKTTRKSLDTTEDVLHMRMMEFRLLCNKTQIIPELSDHSVRIFLAGGDNDVNQAFDGVLEYFNQKKEAKHMFDNRDPMSPDIQQAWEVLKVCFLPKLTPQGYRILLCGLWDPDPAKLDVLACIRMFLMAIDVGLFLENVYQGYVLLLDTEGLTIRHFPWGSLTDYRRFMRFLQYGMPVFVRQIHILRNSKMIERVYTCLKPFMKKELSELLFFHSGNDFTNFLKMVPPDCLPQDLGGTIPSVRPIQDELKKKVEEKIEELSKELAPVVPK